MKAEHRHDMYEEIEDEFARWMNRLPCYISDDTEKGVHECFSKFVMSARTIAQKYELKSQGKLK